MIRKAKLGDLKAVLKLYEDAKKFIKSYDSPQWQDGYPNEQTFLGDLKLEQVFVNEVKNKIVGVASFLTYEPTYDSIEGAWLNAEPYIVIHRITTAIDELGKGYAKAFIDYINQVLGYQNIRIDTHHLNEPMKRFLIKNGFVLCGVITLNQPEDNKRLAYQKVFT